MICPVCGAKCICQKATELCCSCHKHKARGPWARAMREIAHGGALQLLKPDRELFPEMRVTLEEGETLEGLERAQQSSLGLISFRKGAKRQ
jgi:hypothetical protein